MKRYKREEKKEILRILKEKLGTEKVEPLGYNRYSVRKRYPVNLESGQTTWLHNYKLFDEEVNEIALVKKYDDISKFAKGVATVCIRENTKIIETETGTKITEDRKEGLIDVNGKELLPCVFDSVSVKLNGFVEIKKNGIKKATRVNEILSGKFDWDKAIEWD